MTSLFDEEPANNGGADSAARRDAALAAAWLTAHPPLTID
jgi:hypothetical protein